MEILKQSLKELNKQELKFMLILIDKFYLDLLNLEFHYLMDRKMTNTYDGKSTTISENTLPVDKELAHTVSSSTGLTLALTDGGPSCADGGTCPSVSNDLEPFAYDKNTGQFLNSLLTENGEQAPYELGGFPDDDLQDMVKSVSHGSGGDKNVIVQARFLTAGPDAATRYISCIF